MHYGKYLRTNTRLGVGGNGEVWKCTHDGQDFAVKVLTQIQAKRYLRFRSEVGVLVALGDFEGIVPLLDHELPERPTPKQPAWYAMPIGSSALLLMDIPFKKRIDAFVYIAARLALLHDRGVFHRDIKLGNILRINDTWCLADFGLAEWSGALDLTAEGEAIGPKWTQAPEMRRTASNASGAPADVYSYAKTLWITATGQSLGFDGRFDSSVRAQNLKSYLPKEQHLHALHSLLKDCTEYDPDKRPTMVEVHERLKEWAHRDFHSNATLEWHYMQEWVFSQHSPCRSVWYEPTQICAILNEAVAAANINHCFFGDGGGDDLEGCAVEGGLLAYDFGSKYLGRPKLLELVSFIDAPEWSYFWMELLPLAPSGVYSSYDPDDDFEEVVILPDGTSLPRSCWDDDAYIRDGETVPLPSGADLQMRCLKGAWVLLGKASPYNNDPMTYDARHAKLGREAFFEYIRAHVEWTRHGRQGIPDVDPKGPIPIGFKRVRK